MCVFLNVCLESNFGNYSHGGVIITSFLYRNIRNSAISTVSNVLTNALVPRHFIVTTM